MGITTTVNPLDINNPTKGLIPSPTGYPPDSQGTNPNITTTTTTTSTTTSTTLDPNVHSIVPASGFHGNIWPQKLVFPQSLSSAGWTNEAKGFPQQTFLGASIRNFTMNGGFGDSSSSLTVELIVDEYNKSDGTGAGRGDDVYWSGVNLIKGQPIGDKFVPPIPGSPVFFKFGPNLATVEEAYRKTFDDLYYYKTIQDLPINPQEGEISIDNFLLGTEVTLSDNQYVAIEEPTGIVKKLSNAPRPIINYNAIKNNPLSRGKDHIVFGGILQTYNQSRNNNGNPLYNVQVVDPREILSNVTILLNDYSGSTYGQQNIINVYGFLEYNASEKTKDEIKSVLPFENLITKVIQTTGPKIGHSVITGDDRYYKTRPPIESIKAIQEQIKILDDQIKEEIRKISSYRISGDFAGATASNIQINTLLIQINSLKLQLVPLIQQSIPYFPITGSSFARRGPQGIPYYRVRDSINAIMEYYFNLPQEYKDQGFGGKINFRGFNYVVDFGGLPDLPEFYYIDFDQINLLELALEICDITNRDLYVTLLPVIDHPACKFLYDKNKSLPDKEMIAGIIRLDTIDRSDQPLYGSVKQYIENLKSQGIFVQNQDLGYELSNVVTDKFVVGAQEVGTYFFSSNNDRDSLAFRKTGKNGQFPNKPPGYQWTLDCSLNQQILPYYGKLGNAITIPKGFGAYQQILLDSSHLNAAGVGGYYVATEMELRCAMISYDRWKEFLKLYNDVYLDSIEADDVFDTAIVGLTAAPLDKDPPNPVKISNKYVVSVPRSVFDTYAIPVNGSVYGDDGLPLSACNPPYGYPLYYKRMTKIGIPEGGLTDLYNRWNTVLTNFAELQGSNKHDVRGILNSQYTRLKQLKETGGLTSFEQDYFDDLEKALKDPTPKKINETIALIESNIRTGSKNVFPLMGTMAKKNTQNALKVYNFVKSIADECLGRKFLVRIPNKVNLFFNNEIKIDDPSTQEYKQGPFGFMPRSTKNIPGYEYTKEFKDSIEKARSSVDKSKHINDLFLNSGPDKSQDDFTGALRINYNPILEKYESNYVPTNIGGYFSYDLYQNTLGISSIRDLGKNSYSLLPSGVQQFLIPQDLTNFINEDGRISPYVRFDHSQYLSVESLSESEYSQQLITSNGMITDLSENLDNTGPDTEFKFSDPNQNQNQNNDKTNKTSTVTDQVLFVRCSVDEELHMPPKIARRKVLVHGQKVKDIGSKSLPNKIYIPCSGIENKAPVEGSGVYIDSFSYYKAHFIPEPVAGSEVTITDFEAYAPSGIGIPNDIVLNNGFLIGGDSNKLDTRFVYALITIPRVVATKDARLRDGPNQSIATERFKHLMTMDVVRGLPGFELPTDPSISPPTSPLRDVLQKAAPDNKIHAWLAMKKAQQAFSFGLPYKINISSPSPVYPDLISLPLLAKDRCYGPWISSQLDSKAYVLSNIGGRVEFIKDENLSPWNYGGYDLLNKAGTLQAQFSNSLLLFSERGSFTIASFPSGTSLCKALSLGGPLVTNINVDVSDGGCHTTYQMDLYTASFGKLQKQKQELISKISRDRKRLISERNALIRKGLGKNQNRRNFVNEYASISKGSTPSISDIGLGMTNAYTRIVTSIDNRTSNSWSSIAGDLVDTKQYVIDGSIQQDSDAAKAVQFMTDQYLVASKYQNAGSAEISEIWVPTSYGYHPNMSYVEFKHEEAKQDLYIDRGQA